MNGYYNTAATVNASFPNAQPSRASYATKVNSGQGGSGYTWFSGDQNPSLGYSPFGYTYWYTSSLRLVYRNASGYTTTYYEYTTANEFVNVAYENIDWTSKTFDIVIDGVTIGKNLIRRITAFKISTLFKNTYYLFRTLFQCPCWYCLLSFFILGFAFAFMFSSGCFTTRIFFAAITW